MPIMMPNTAYVCVSKQDFEFITDLLKKNRFRIKSEGEQPMGYQVPPKTQKKVTMVLGRYGFFTSDRLYLQGAKRKKNFTTLDGINRTILEYERG